MDQLQNNTDEIKDFCASNNKDVNQLLHIIACRFLIARLKNASGIQVKIPRDNTEIDLVIEHYKKIGFRVEEKGDASDPKRTIIFNS